MGAQTGEVNVPLVVTNIYRRSDLRVVVKQFCPIDGLADATMRGGVARQNSDVHPDTFAGKSKEPLHGRAGEVRSARSGIDSRTDACADDAPRTIDEVAVKTGVMIGVFFHNAKMPGRGTVAAFSG